jgi:DNA-binding response OmpR family regulator/tetratricopeptide (TPR) repeat protein
MGTVLYIDDERQLPAGFEEELREAGYRLLHTADPDEALTLVRVEEIDLVLAEVVLSSCNGIALLDEIRSYGGWPAQVPIIVLTKGERSPELYGGALEFGVKEFFTKPALKAELLESVQQFAGNVLEPTDVDPSEPSSAPESEAATSGDLARIPISEVLRRLRLDAASGVLSVTHRKDRKAFELRNGSPSAASASGGVEAPEEFLARRGRISQEQRQAVKERVGAGKGSSREMLVVLGALSEQEFTAVMREQAEEQLFETFRWTSGAFHYFPDKHLRADVALEIDRSQAALMLEGVRHWSSQEVVAEALRPRAPLYVSRVDDLPCEPSELDLSSAERVFFEHMYGDRSVREVLNSGDLDARTLYGLFAAGLLVLHEEPVVVLLDAAPAAEQPQRAAHPEAPRAKEAPLEPPLDFETDARATAPGEPVIDPSELEGVEPFVESFAAADAELLVELSGPADLELELDPEPPQAEAETPSSEPSALPDLELEPDPEPARAAAAPSIEPAPPPEAGLEPAPAPPRAPPVESPTPAGDAERALAELTAFCEQIRDEDDFDVLGIGVDTSDAEVRYAYEGLVDTLPSEELSLELPALKDLVEEARKRIDRAFEHLRLSSTRKVYAQLRPQIAKGRKKVQTAKTPEQLAAEKAAHLEELSSRGLDAETWFRRGDGFLQAENFAQAVEAYGMAAHLDPREGEYLARLGYAQFLHRPKDAVVLREALENIAKGIKLSPNREKPYVYLGKIFRENGAQDRARKMFKNALRIKPDCHEALQELHQLDLALAKGGKLLGRLKGIIG